MGKIEFFKDHSEANRYQVLEIVGKGSYGVVCSAVDKQTGEKVAIKKINDIFEHVSDATRILREIKLLRLLKHPDIVEIKHILLPPSSREFKDIYVVFELMEADLHQVIKANDDLTQEHYQFFLYQLLRALKFIHSANVFHRDLKPKNVLANSDCKLKLCDFGLARVAFNGSSSAIFWTDYVATRWYRAPELCGAFYSKVQGTANQFLMSILKKKETLKSCIFNCLLKQVLSITRLLFQYTTAVDIWSVGCIFAEVLLGKPLFPGRNVVNQLELITDLLGTPPPDVISRIRNDKARRYLTNMRRKQPGSFYQKFPNIDPMAVKLLQKLLSFDAKDRPTAEQALADPYFKGLAKLEREPSSQPACRADFDFERRRINKEDVRELIYREILEYHPEMLKQHVNSRGQSRFTYPSAVDQLKRQFDYAQRQSKEFSPVERKHSSLPRERVLLPLEESKSQVKENCVSNGVKSRLARGNEVRAPLGVHKVVDKNGDKGEQFKVSKAVVPVTHEGEVDESVQKETSNVKKLVKSASVRRSQPVLAQPKTKAVLMSDQDTKKKDYRLSEGKTVQSKSKSMGSTVAKLVAVFSNGMPH
ncbi:hypothetical protein KP509_13G002500 [Ceratopteris richardii]|uniref:Protein kinase domain-containing protein n=1 Tax=Ceratopteris richardii TaxID=49495 RepID=A0A8T2TFY8_CERRI|nr:hypothetical protein KP509_13G002500 [Ceratopteris richardii]